MRVAPLALIIALILKTLQNYFADMEKVLFSYMLYSKLYEVSNFMIKLKF